MAGAWNYSISQCIAQTLGDSLKVISSSFDFISFTRVFRELNTVVDTLSKEGQHLNEGQILIETRDGSSVASSQSF